MEVPDGNRSHDRELADRADQAERSLVSAVAAAHNDRLLELGLLEPGPTALLIRR